MADIDTPAMAASLDDEARRIRAEIRMDEANLRVKKLEVSKLDHAVAIKKIDSEIATLIKEIKKLESDSKK